jgi:hypothetical protein
MKRKSLILVQMWTSCFARPAPQFHHDHVPGKVHPEYMYNLPSNRHNRSLWGARIARPRIYFPNIAGNEPIPSLPEFLPRNLYSLSWLIALIN